MVLKRKITIIRESLRKPIAILMVMALMMLAATPCGAAEKVGYTGKYPWHVTAFWGAAFQEKLRDLFTFQARFEDDTYVAGMALSRDIWHYKDWLAIGLEGQVSKHYGEMADQWEFVGVFVFRYLKLP